MATAASNTTNDISNFKQIPSIRILKLFSDIFVAENYFIKDKREILS